MPYVGNEPTSNFASVTKDLFSGDGSTVAFTLSKASTTNGVAVFVENVRQEPTIAYAVSGTTLTFTAAPVTSSGNNIYVLHHNAVASTANHPAAQDLTAVKGTFTGDLTIGGTDLFVDTSAEKLGIGTATASQLHQKVNIYSSSEAGIQFMNDATGVTNSTDGARISVYEDDIQYTNYESAGKQIFNVASSIKAMEIDSAGHITMAKQPAFAATPSTGQSNISKDASVTVAFGTEIYDQNGDFASNTFTAPVAGKYQLNTTNFLFDVDSAAAYYMLQIVTSNRVYQSIFDPDFGQDAVYWSIQMNMLADMDASDTAHVIIYQSGGSTNQTDIIHDSNASHFNGYLVC